MERNETIKKKAGVAESKIFPHNLRHLFARIYYKVTKILQVLLIYLDIAVSMLQEYIQQLQKQCSKRSWIGLSNRKYWNVQHNICYVVYGQIKFRTI